MTASSDAKLLAGYEFASCCDWASQPVVPVSKHGPAIWIVQSVVCCDAIHVHLLCEKCRKFLMTAHGSAMCRECGTIVSPARLAVATVQPLNGDR